MRRLLQRLRSRVERFVEQRDDLALLIACSDDDLALVLKTVRDVEMADASDVFLFTAGPFHSPAAFANEALTDLRAQRDLAAAALAEAGKAPLPPFPASLLSATLAPEDRLRGAINYARGLLPPDGGHRLVWTLAPMQVHDLPGYLQLLRSLLPVHDVEPWMRGLRLILRLPTSGEVPSLRAPRCTVEPVDFGPAALQRSLEEEADDEAIPEAERMQALLTSAWLDSTQRRPVPAAEKFQYLLGYYQHTENPTMQAMVMHGLGDTLRLQGAAPDALRWYECALAAAVEARAPVLIATTGWSLAGMAWDDGRFGEAARYYDGLHTLAGQLLDAEQKARALEWRGLCEERLQRTADAVASWEVACELCRAVGMDGLLRSSLQHLVRGCSALGDDRRAQAARQELDELPEVSA